MVKANYALSNSAQKSSENGQRSSEVAGMFSEILVMIRWKSLVFDSEKVNRDITSPGDGGKKGGEFDEQERGKRGLPFVLFFPLPPFYACPLITLPKVFQLLTCAFWQKSIGASSKGTLNLAY